MGINDSFYVLIQLQNRRDFCLAGPVTVTGAVHKAVEFVGKAGVTPLHEQRPDLGYPAPLTVQIPHGFAGFLLCMSSWPTSCNL